MSERDNWMTPRWFCDMVHEALGFIELDPMSSVEANTNVRACDFWSEGALERQWKAETLFFQPPYSTEVFRPAVAHFIAQQHSIGQAIALTNAVHDTKSGAALLRECSALCLPDRRIQFDPPPGVKKSSNRFNQMVTYYGNRPDWFEAVFVDLGVVFT